MNKNVFRFYNLLEILIFISLIKFQNNQEEKIIPSILYPSTLTLLSGNILLLSSDGIHFYSSDLLIEDTSKKIIFEKSISKTEIEKIAMAQFSSKDKGYIMVLVNDIIYFFEPDGIKIAYKNLSNLINANHYSLVPFKNENNNLYFIISYLESNNLILKQFKFNIFAYSIELTSSNKFDIYLQYKNNNDKPESLAGNSCIFMSPSSIDHDILTCFYTVYYPTEIHSRSFDPSDNFKELTNYFHYYYNSLDFPTLFYISAITNNDKKKALVFVVSLRSFWLTFDFDNLFSESVELFTDSSEKLDMTYTQTKTFYFRQTHEFIFLSKTQNCNKYLMVFNNDFTLKEYSYLNPSDCYMSASHSLFFDGTYYNIITDNDDKNQPKIFIYPEIDLGISETVEDLVIIDKNDLCNEETFYKGKCNKDIYNSFLLEDMINKIRFDIINHKIDDLLSNLIYENKDDLVIQSNKTLYQITSTYNQINNIYYNISSIKLEECEYILKNNSNINKNTTLIIFKIDIYQEGLSLPIIEYEIYEPINNTQLNLKLCNNTKIDIDIPVSIDETQLYKYNLSSEYYNDKCFPSKSEKNTDIILSDRINEYIIKNLSLCEQNCISKEYKLNYRITKCECDVKTEINLDYSIFRYIDKDKLISNFIDIKSIINIHVVKCYKLLFSKEGLLKNCGSYIILIILLYQIISFIYFKVKGFNEYVSKIKSIFKIDKKNKKDSLTEKKNNPLKKKNKKKQGKSNELKNNNDELSRSNIKIKGTINRKLTYNKKLQKKSTLDKDISIYNNKKNNKTNENFTEYELNLLEYEDAIKFDKRTYLQIYMSLLRVNHLLLLTFFNDQDYNSFIMKTCLYFFSFSLYLTVNIFFFNDSTIHKIYEDEGKFNFIYQIPQILYSTFISSTILFLIKYFSLFQKDILKIKYEKKNIKERFIDVMKCINKKYLYFFLFTIIFLIFFWYYLSCFCAVYINTQIHIICDTFISFGLSLLYPFILSSLRKISLNNKEKKRKFLYKISQLI